MALVEILTVARVWRNLKK